MASFKKLKHMNKAIVGVDVSKDDFHVCFKVREGSQKSIIKGRRKFKNSEKGFKELLEWINKRERDTDVQVLMEATGVYHESLAYFLYEQGILVSIVLANKMKNYLKSLNIKTKTDRTDAASIAEYGTERHLVPWEPMSPQYKELRDMCRELLSQKKDLQKAKSQLHAYNSSFQKSPEIVDLKNEQVQLTEKLIASLEDLIQKTVNKDQALLKKLRKTETIPGLGFITSVILVCETNGFRLFNSIRQIVSYAGLDVTFNQSGKFNGKSHISKKGNSRIRQALYMPALSATQCNQPIKAQYERICLKNPTVKRKGVVAGMRKLLILAYTIWKKDEEFDLNYRWETKSTQPSKDACNKKNGANSPAQDRLQLSESTVAFF